MAEQATSVGTAIRTVATLLLWTTIISCLFLVFGQFSRSLTGALGVIPTNDRLLAALNIGFACLPAIILSGPILGSSTRYKSAKANKAFSFQQKNVLGITILFCVVMLAYVTWAVAFANYNPATPPTKPPEVQPLLQVADPANEVQEFPSLIENIQFLSTFISFYLVLLIWMARELIGDNESA